MTTFHRSKGVSRREFLHSTAAIATMASMGPFIVRGQNLNSKLNVAGIGVGGKGSSDIAGMAASENIVALCDIDRNTLNSGAEKYPKAKLYHDYRLMLEEQKEIDTVTVSTPDHQHGPAAMMALQLGKNVYCQKPLTRSVYEARMLKLAARQAGVATIMGNQGHSGEGVRRAKELIQAGVVGKVREAHCWTDRPIWPQALDRPTETPPVPNSVDWYLWVGPAPSRPYHPIYHPFKWRGWWDFGTGALGDMACHVMDAVNYALDLDAPTSIEAESSEVYPETFPNWAIVRYQFPARGEMPPVKATWHDGGKRPDNSTLGLGSDEEAPSNGLVFVGDKGKLLCGTYGSDPQLFVDGSREELPDVPKTIRRVEGHYEEFIRACKGGPAAGSNFDYAGPFTEWVLLGNVAIKTGQRVEWDAKNLRVKNIPEAASLIRPHFRKGWVM